VTRYDETAMIDAVAAVSQLIIGFIIVV